MAEYMNDEPPACNDGRDINVPKAPTPPPQRTFPPAPKLQVNKRGGQKLGGGRR